MSQMVPVVLVVEEDPNLAKIYEERFKKEKFVVVLSSDGEDAIVKVVQEKPDLILLNLMLPKKGGFGVMQILKSMPTTKDIPVIMLSAFLQKEYIEKANYYGAERFLLKTEYTPADIVTQAKEIIGWN
mgnify:CR=1 FL=1